MLNKAKVSFIFILVCIISIGIWIYFKDIKTAAIIFIGYAVIRITGNFLKTLKDEIEEIYYE